MTATEKDTTYNGWANYETWNVALWLDNEEGSQRTLRAMAQEAWDDAESTKVWTRDESARFALADAIKEMVEEAAPDLGASMFSDLLNAALSEVHWDDIAEHYMDDVDKDEPEEDDEE